MAMEPIGRARTAEARRVARAEDAVADLDRQLADWDEQRAELVADGLGRDPLRHVSRTWPIKVSADASAAARQAAPLSPHTLEAETSALWWSAIGKLIGAGVAITLVLSVPVALVLNSIG